jgi:hypothetical protein
MSLQVQSSYKKGHPRNTTPFLFLFLISAWSLPYDRSKLEKNVNEGDTYHTYAHGSRLMYYFLVVEICNNLLLFYLLTAIIISSFCHHYSIIFCRIVYARSHNISLFVLHNYYSTPFVCSLQ